MDLLSHIQKGLNLAKELNVQYARKYNGTQKGLGNGILVITSNAKREADISYVILTL